MKYSDVRFLNGLKLRDTGYSKYFSKWKYYTSIYNISSNEDKEVMVEEVVEDYYTEMIFPMLYLSEKDIRDDLRQVSLTKCSVENSTISSATRGYGQKACRNVVTEVLFAKSTGRGAKSEVDMFLAEDRMRATIKFKMSNGIVPYPETVREYFTMSGGGVQNFSPERAKAIYSYYTNKNDVVYDSSCGFGGRLVGSYAACNRLSYIGVEPCTNTYSQLLQLDKYCSKAYRIKESTTEIHCIGSEDFIPDKESIDFSFTSPPYFDLEIYGEESTQSIIKFPEYSQWLNGFVYNTMKNIRYGLKQDKFVGINIKNIPKYPLYDDWLEVSKEVGFILKEEILMSIGSSSNTRHRGRGENECIMILQKLN